MPDKNNPEWWLQINEQSDLENEQPTSHKNKRKYTATKKDAKPADIVLQTDTISEFNFTYQATRHEREWLLQSLGSFYEHRWIEDVIRMVKGGKEASVYLCQANPAITPGLVAAKVYRPRKLRNLRNDHLYREGRSDLDAEGNLITNHGMLHAMRKKTQYGLELLHTSWLEHEFSTLKTLFSAGADVPKPYASENNALLIGYVGDETAAGPTLQSVRLVSSEARQLFQRLLKNLEIMLANNIIHGDLSAYNVLYWDGAITIIDFPQAIAPEQNPSSFSIFKRDITRLCEYFFRYKNVIPQANHPDKLAADLWTSYNHRLIPDIHPGLLNEEDEQDVAFWKSIHSEGTK